MGDLPLIWAHRGASGYAPENTLPAFKLASDMEADGVELDVQLTKVCFATPKRIKLQNLLG